MNVVKPKKKKKTFNSGFLSIYFYQALANQNEKCTCIMDKQFKSSYC